MTEDDLRANIAVDDRGCRLWQGRMLKGYGITKVAGKTAGAHRVALALRLGRPLKPDELACHHCDVPRCVNPQHLFVGTQSDNMQDAKQKGRARFVASAPGGAGNNATLTDVDATEIRRLAQDPLTRFEALAERFGVSMTAIYECVRGDTFKNLPVLSVPRRTYKGTPRVDPNHIRCNRCKAVKRNDQFAPSTAKRGSGWCTACQTEHQRLRKQQVVTAPCAPIPDSCK